LRMLNRVDYSRRNNPGREVDYGRLAEASVGRQ
jgi:hypothetical protein